MAEQTLPVQSQIAWTLVDGAILASFLTVFSIIRANVPGEKLLAPDFSPGKPVFKSAGTLGYKTLGSSLGALNFPERTA
jgi:hypothetical protein